MSNWPLLSVLIWLPILGGALVLALGNARAGAARWLGFAVAVLTFVFSLGLLSGFDYANPGLQFIESHAWIRASTSTTTWAPMASPSPCCCSTR